MSRGSWWMALIGLFLVLIGVWGAWVPHRAAALVLSSWDLAEFVRFVPGTSSTRELFYLPVWCAGIALAVLAIQPTVGLVRRVTIAAIALALVLAILPPYPHLLNGYQSAEHRWRFILGAAGILLVLSLLLARRRLQSGRPWSGRTIAVLLLVLAAAGAIPALWQFLQVRGAIEQIYGARLGWGWGLALFLGGWALVGGAAGRMLLRGERRSNVPVNTAQ